ncbi:MAG TPA: hypothetical protein VMZ71_06820 [Gemmataceae bacterium]|nr:hypothetical protein [Gemmataceae bacterium]
MGEPSINLEPWHLKQHYACFECRKAFKAGGEFVRDAAGERVRRVVGCPNCGRPMTPMGRQFRAPRQAAVRAWARLAELTTALLDPPFEHARADRPRPAGCPSCGSLTGWDGRLCPYCGHERPRGPS